MSQQEEQDFDGELDQFDLNKILIDLIQHYKYLFNLCHKDYKNTAKKEAAWSEIAAVLNITAEQCKKTWISLRNKFTREKREGSRSGSAAEEKCPLFSKMLFFEKYSRPRKTYTNIESLASRAGPSGLHRPDPSSRPQPAASLPLSSPGPSSSPGSPWSTMECLVSPSENVVESGEDLPNRVDETPRSVKNRRISNKAEEELMGIAKQLANSISKPLNQNRTFVEHVFTVLEEMTPEESKAKRREVMMILYQ